MSCGLPICGFLFFIRLKSDLPVAFVLLQELEVAGKKAIVIFIPVPLWRALQRIHVSF